MQYEVGKGLWKFAKGVGTGALALVIAQFSDATAITDALGPAAPEGIGVAIAGGVRFLANYLKVKGLFGAGA